MNEHPRRGGARSAPAPAPRPPERAQIVWQRALELAGPRAFHDPFANALDLLRSAHHDPATMAHALSLGQAEVRRHGDNAVARAAAEVLEAAIVFLGVKPRTGDIAHRRPASGLPSRPARSAAETGRPVSTGKPSPSVSVG